MRATLLLGATFLLPCFAHAAVDGLSFAIAERGPSHRVWKMFTGFHLGAVTNLSSTSAGTWAWTNSPTGPLNGRGNFDTNCEYAGAIHTVVNTNVFFLYQGEKRQKAQGNDHPANQFFHYSIGGTFLGQFGYPRPNGNRNRPGSGNNLLTFSAVSTNGVTYIYSPDEASHGVHRWRVDR